MKVLILSCSTGQGHNSAGRAVQEELMNRHIDCKFVDTYALTGGGKTSQRVSNVYDNITVHAPTMFGLLYHAGEIVSSPRRKSPVYGVNALYMNKVYQYILANGFDTLIMPHIFPAQVYTGLKRRKKLDLRSISLITDYTCSPFWEETDVDHIIIPHELLMDEFLAHGVKREKLIPLGIPVSRTFSERMDKQQARAQLGLPQHLPVFVMMSGSMGFGRLDELVRGLLTEYGKSASIVVLGGNNHAMKGKLRAQYAYTPNVYIKDYTSRVSLYLDAGDVVFTKPGGLTITELAVKNIPAVLTAPIPGGERHNAEFFEHNHLAFYRPTLPGQLEAARCILTDSGCRTAMMNTQRALINANAAQDICDFLLKEGK